MIIISNTSANIDKIPIEWKCNFHSHAVKISFLSKKKGLYITCFLSSKLNFNHFIDYYTLFFYRLLFSLTDLKFVPASLILKDINQDEFELFISVNANSKRIYHSLTKREAVSNIFAQYPEINFKKSIYTWGWINEGPSNLIHYIENELLIYDFFLDYEPIGVVKWKIKTNTVEGKTSTLCLKFQDIILHTERNRRDAFNQYRLGWMLLLFKVKDYAENGKLSLNCKKS